ncbi:T6SS phospholipase effector Tle1-like catalytic domain-containing protein [Massilia sp. TN1-12]|uniref:T6SS phospholipase effector Tle1-like catalytic domain-containing protein n=1 Tax=Massilia paldalensis TaxID=3377675 RepID=UPI00384AADF5
MTTGLCAPIPELFTKSADKSSFFNQTEQLILRNLENIEKPAQNSPLAICRENLYFGFFFDGTRNNYIKAEDTKSHSNVARLYDCFPGTDAVGVLPNARWTYKDDTFKDFKNYFRTYIPGVATPFDKIKDPGKGWQALFGGAMGLGGSSRIGWALVQAINNVHRFFLGQPLVSGEEEYRATCAKFSWLQRENMFFQDPVFEDMSDSNRDTCRHLTALLRKLHFAVKQHWHAPGELPAKKDPGIVETIHISIFGFSRGATQARAFANWLIALCELDAQLCKKTGRTLGGFPVRFDFIGIFDTVGSVGVGATFADKFWGRFADGHGDWADSERNLRIPAGVPCLHLVAAHEIRRSFPVDSISIRGVLPDKCNEIVIPGVHSDIGSGYTPKEQGRGITDDGSDMLARVPLIMMYKAARLSGVPLKLEWAPEIAKQRFAISKNVIDDLNSYLECCSVKEGSLTDIMREQAHLRILYHRTRRIGGKTPITETDSFKRATMFDKNDLRGAYEELNAEVDAFEQSLASGKTSAPSQPQGPGLEDKAEEWREIALWWKKNETAPAAVLKLFDDYIHDSRAWFKIAINAKDNEADLIKELETWKHTVEAAELRAKSSGAKPYYGGLDAEQVKAAKDYAKTGTIPEMKTFGRENWEIAGYLRYRRIYAGGDSMMITKTEQVPAPAAAFASVESGRGKESAAI